MEGKRPYRATGFTLINMQVVRLGKILFNLQFVGLFFVLASALTFALPVLFYVLLFTVCMLTLFTIFAWYPPSLSWWKGGEVLANIAILLSTSWKYIIPIVAVLSVSSAVCLLFDRKEKHIARIAVSVAVFVVTGILTLILISNAGAAA